MKPQLLLSLLLAALLPMTASAQSGEGEFPDLFNTSAAYDILAVFPQADKLAEDPFFTGTLGADTLFLDRAHRIDSVVRPSQLCNLYSLSGGSKDDPEQVVEFFASFDPESLPQKCGVLGSTKYAASATNSLTACNGSHKRVTHNIGRSRCGPA